MQIFKPKGVLMPSAMLFFWSTKTIPVRKGIYIENTVAHKGQNVCPETRMFCVEMELLHAETRMFCVEMELLHAETRMFCVEIELLHAETRMFCVEIELLRRNVTLFRGNAHMLPSKNKHVPRNRDAAAFKYLPSLSSAGSTLENETLLHETNKLLKRGVSWKRNPSTWN